MSIHRQSVIGAIREFSTKGKIRTFSASPWKTTVLVFMTDEEESSLQAVTSSKTVLSPKQTELLEVFDQLPEIEQERFIELARIRLEELDRFMAEFLSKRKISPSSDKD